MKQRTNVRGVQPAQDAVAGGARYYPLKIVNQKRSPLCSSFSEKERYGEGFNNLLDKFSTSSVSMATSVYSIRDVAVADHRGNLNVRDSKLVYEAIRIQLSNTNGNDSTNKLYHDIQYKK